MGRKGEGNNGKEIRKMVGKKEENGWKKRRKWLVEKKKLLEKKMIGRWLEGMKMIRRK